MGQILVQDLKDETLTALQERAKANNRSLEAEVRAIIEAAVLPSLSGASARKSILEFAGSAPTSRSTQEIVDETRKLRDEWDD